MTEHTHKVVCDCSVKNKKGFAEGQQVTLTEQELAEHAQKDADWEAAAPARAKADAQREIADLERANSLPRHTREALLASESVHPAAQIKIKAFHNQIAEIAVKSGIRGTAS